MKQEESLGRTRTQNSSRAGAEAVHPGTTAEVDPDTNGMQGSAGNVHACNPSAQDADTGRAV